LHFYHRISLLPPQRPNCRRKLVNASSAESRCFGTTNVYRPLVSASAFPDRRINKHFAIGTGAGTNRGGKNHWRRLRCLRRSLRPSSGGVFATALKAGQPSSRRWRKLAATFGLLMWRPISPCGAFDRVSADDQFKLVITRSSSSQRRNFPCSSRSWICTRRTPAEPARASRSFASFRDTGPDNFE
jgi:hypothetical protein